MVKSRAAADRILKTVRDDPSFKADPIKVWETLREHSIDSATAMRRGNLGFVRPDGSTAHKHVKIDPTIYQARRRSETARSFRRRSR